MATAWRANSGQNTPSQTTGFYCGWTFESVTLRFGAELAACNGEGSVGMF